MSGYYVNRPSSNSGPGDEHFNAIAEEYPAIAWILAGRPKDHAEGQMMPLSLILFLDQGKLKFCFSSKNAVDCCFGCVDKPEAILASVEASIRDGRLEWKKSRR